MPKHTHQRLFKHVVTPSFARANTPSHSYSTDKMLRNMLGQKSNLMSRSGIVVGNMLNNSGGKPAPMFRQQQWKKFTPAMRDWARGKFFDSDGDRVPDRYDCQPMNPFRQDSMPNRLQRQRIEALPVYVYGGNRQELFTPATQHNWKHVLDKDLNQRQKLARQGFYETVKVNPGIITDIEKEKTKLYVMETPKRIEGGKVAYAYTAYNKKQEKLPTHIVFTTEKTNRAQDAKPQAQSLFHEMQHIKEFNEGDYKQFKEAQKKYDKKNWYNNPEEIRAEEYGYGRIAELYGKEGGKFLPDRIKFESHVYKKDLEDERYEPSQDPEAIRLNEENKNLRISSQLKQKELDERNKETAMSTWFGDKPEGMKDNDGDGLPNAFDCCPNDPKKQGWHNITTVPAFDNPNEYGYGYKTKIVNISPDKFFDYAQKTADKEEWRNAPRDKYIEETTGGRSNVWIKDNLNNPECKVPIPFIEFNKGIPTEHEGRLRAATAKELGYKDIPVMFVETNKNFNPIWKEDTK